MQVRQPKNAVEVAQVFYSDNWAINKRDFLLWTHMLCEILLLFYMLTSC